MEWDEIEALEEEAEEKAQVTVFRYHPERMDESKYENYEVPFIDGLSVSNVLEYIRKRKDKSLAYYLSCRIGKCQGCMVKVNGEVMRACTEPAQKKMKIEPINKDKVIKDLVVETE